MQEVCQSQYATLTILIFKTPWKHSQRDGPGLGLFSQLQFVDEINLFFQTRLLLSRWTLADVWTFVCVYYGSLQARIRVNNLTRNISVIDLTVDKAIVSL